MAHETELAWKWVNAPEVENTPGVPERFAAVWLVPASPYRSMARRVPTWCSA